MIRIIPNFITPEEGRKILSHLTPSRVPSGFARNRIYRYGSRLPYSAPTKPIPEWLVDICMRVTEEWQKLWHEGIYEYNGKVDHVTINEYHKGQAIDWHIDSPTSGEIITVLSLESDAVMGLKDESSETSFDLPPHSLLHMTGEDRWKKKHCIHPVPFHRWSLVFRKGTS